MPPIEMSKKTTGLEYVSSFMLLTGSLLDILAGQRPERGSQLRETNGRVVGLGVGQSLARVIVRRFEQTTVVKLRGRGQTARPSPMAPRQWQLSVLLCLLSLILPILAFHTQSHATVHQFLPPRLQGNQKHHRPLSLTPSESRLIYSTIFGVSRFHTMGFVGQFAHVLDLQRAWRQDDLFEQDLLGGAVVTVAGVVEEHEEALVGRKSGGNVLFRIGESPNGRAFLDLMGRMMGQRGDVSGEEVQRLYANTMGGEISVVPALEVQHLTIVVGRGLLMF